MPALPSLQKPNEHSSTEAGKQSIWPHSESDIFYEGYTDTIQTLMKKYGITIHSNLAIYVILASMHRSKLT